MTEAESQYFEAMESLFASPGWKVLKDDITGWMTAISSQWRTIKPEDLKYAQGRYDGLSQVLEHFALCETLKAQSQEAALEDLDAQTL